MSLPSQDFYARLTPTELAGLRAKQERRARMGMAPTRLLPMQAIYQVAAEPAVVLAAIEPVPVVEEPAAPVAAVATDMFHAAWLLLDKQGPLRLTIRRIFRVTAEHYGFKLHDLLSHRRTADIVRPRHVAMYLAKELTLFSYPEIGRQMDGRDHSTIIHGVQKIERLLETDTQLQADIAFLTSQLKPDSEAGV